MVADVPGVYTVKVSAGPLTDEKSFRVVQRDVIRRVDIVGHGRQNTHYTSDFWIFEGVDGRDYALTGAIFARDRIALSRMSDALRHTAGNFYLNDKPTGAVVGQQPFGGGRASGTNDKAGSKLNLLRWCSARTIKETFHPPTDYRYPFMTTEF